MSGNIRGVVSRDIVPLNDITLVKAGKKILQIVSGFNGTHGIFNEEAKKLNGFEYILRNRSVKETDTSMAFMSSFIARMNEVYPEKCDNRRVLIFTLYFIVHDQCPRRFG